MKKTLLAVILMGLPAYALAQATPPEPPLDPQALSQVLGGKLMTELNAGVECQARLTTARNRLSVLEKQLAEKAAAPPEAPK